MKARFFRIATLLTAALGCAPAIGQVEDYPGKPVRLVIQYPPGGSVDALARAMGSELGKLWGQAVVVEGKPGAGGITATASVAHSAADGYTILLIDQGPLTVTPFMQRDLPFDPVRDFAAVVALVQASSLVVVPANSPLNTIPELIAAAKVKPGALNYGTWGVGSVSHLGTEDFATMAGIALTHVPYKGAADVSRGLMGGEVQLAFHSVGATVAQIKQGRLKAIAYAGLKRPPLLPDVPTITESGLPGFYARSWLGIVAPAATPRTIINRIAADAGRVLAVQPFVDKYINGAGFEVFNLPPEPFARVIQETRLKNEAQIKRLKLQAH
jgi:tripartite-type tricarboxylate transporter receptor subunit TctC